MAAVNASTPGEPLDAELELLELPELVLLDELEELLELALLVLLLVLLVLLLVLLVLLLVLLALAAELLAGSPAPPLHPASTHKAATATNNERINSLGFDNVN